MSDTDLKAIYLYSGFLVYGVDGFLSFIDCSDHYEFLLHSHHIDEVLSKKFQETSSTKKQKLSHSVKGLVKMADNVIVFTNDKVKATEYSANFTTKMRDYPECNKFKTATHTSSKSRRQHPELFPEDKKSKFNVRMNNYLKNKGKMPSLLKIFRRVGMTRKLPRPSSRVLVNCLFSRSTVSSNGQLVLTS